MFKRVFIFAYGLISYAVFFATFLYAIGFIGNFDVAGLVPVALDGPPRLPFGTAVAVDLGLLALFAVQHSLMARPFFKRWLTRLIPEPAERSTYVLFSSLALIALFVFWQPLGGVIWDVQDPTGRAVLLALFAFGWLLVLVATFLINHFDLFGLRQVWLYFRGREYTPLPFVTPGPYKFVRHPLYVGWLCAFWGTPTMTVAHLLFAVITTAHILIAIRWEERDLVAHHGPAYSNYQRNVSMIVPRPTRKGITSHDRDTETGAAPFVPQS